MSHKFFQANNSNGGVLAVPGHARVETITLRSGYK